MLQAMFRAAVGDDVFRDDPTVNALEERCAALFGHEAALFCPSGTMANQIALKMHTRPLDEVICDEMSHIYQYEVGGYAFHSGIGVNLLQGKNGLLDAEMVEAAIKPAYDWLPRSTLVVLENTCNKGGGGCYALDTMQAIGEVCRRRGLALHLDGARIFNAIIARGYTTAEVGKVFDSVSMCLSKGLGAPIGSVLTGSREAMAAARRIRKAFGGGMRQVGYLAAAGLYALDHHIERLHNDHAHAQMLADALADLPWVAAIRPVETNIVIFDLHPPHTAATVLDYLAGCGIKAAAFGPQTVRFVTHLDVDRSMIDKAQVALRAFKA
jgi:threonine aldolase